MPRNKVIKHNRRVNMGIAIKKLKVKKIREYRK